MDLALFVEREDHGVGRWIDVKPDNIGQLGGKARIVRTLEGADAVGLQLVHLPMRCTERSEMPTALAIAPPVQWVAWCGGVVQVL